MKWRLRGYQKIILEGNRLFEEFKGALTEQYVLQQLITDPENDIFYWSAENATAELDFLIQTDEYMIPLEAASLQPGYDCRRDVYSLYHLLNHLNMFGTACV